MLIEYRFYFDNLANEERKELVSNIEKYSFTNEICQLKYIDCCVEKEYVEVLLNSLPKNVKYEKLRG